MTEESSPTIPSELEPPAEKRTWRMAGVMLLLMTLSRILVVTLGMERSIFEGSALRNFVIDFVLAIGLIAGWKGARTWVLWRAVIGALFYAYWTISQHAYTELVAQLAISGGLLLSLLGKPSIKRTALGGMLFTLGLVSILGGWIASGAFDELSPNKRAVNALLEQGYTALGSEDYTTAVETFNKVLEQDPKSALAYNGLGWVHDDLGEYEEALADYEHAMTLEPRNPSFLANHAITLDNMDRMEEALVDIDKAIELDNTDWALYGIRGWLHYELEHYDKAKQDLETALQKAPKDADTSDVQDVLKLLESENIGTSG